MKGFAGDRSAHNTRIKRLWREYNNNAMDNFAEIFTNSEETGTLNRENNIDIWALHEVHVYT